MQRNSWSQSTALIQVNLAIGIDKEIRIIEGPSLLRNGCKVLVYERSYYQ